jgi:hypothetical protein
LYGLKELSISLKGAPISPLILISKLKSQYDDETHLIQVGEKPNLPTTLNRNPHFILSKVFPKSNNKITTF